MVNYTVYRVANGIYDDFESDIDASRLILSAKHFFVDGLEVAVECYDGPELLSRSEMLYNDQKQEIEQREYMGTEEIPFRITVQEYNERGQLTLKSIHYGDEEPLLDVNIYDGKGRLLESTYRDEEGLEISKMYTYEGDCPEEATMRQYDEQVLAGVSTYQYKPVNGKYQLIEEKFEHKLDPFQSRTWKFFAAGERLNGVAVVEYNSEGDYLEEEREVHDFKGNVLQRSWHLDAPADCPPYKVFIYTYDSANRLTMESHLYKGATTFLNRIRYDSRGRKVREHLDMGQGDDILIFKYHD